MNNFDLKQLHSDSRRVFNELWTIFSRDFVWLDLSKVSSKVYENAWATILMDDYISPQILSALKDCKFDENNLRSFFDFVEKCLESEDSVLVDVIESTIIEKLAAEDMVRLELVMPLCSHSTRGAIIKSKRDFYCCKTRAEDLTAKYM